MLNTRLYSPLLFVIHVSVARLRSHRAFCTFYIARYLQFGAGREYKPKKKWTENPAQSTVYQFQNHRKQLRSVCSDPRRNNGRCAERLCSTNVTVCFRAGNLGYGAGPPVASGGHHKVR
uniref:Putative secreted protein n=1 Tax=Anopheles darlingi TaxID=43151 RepID=A0A2M4DHM0_ANODA